MDNYTFIIKHFTLNISPDHENKKTKTELNNNKKRKKIVFFFFFFFQIIKKDTDKKGKWSFFIPL